MALPLKANLLYAGQSAQSGAASEAARSGMVSDRTRHLAGVRDINWLLTFMPANTEDKMHASCALGPWTQHESLSTFSASSRIMFVMSWGLCLFGGRAPRSEGTRGPRHDSINPWASRTP
jgi:hypothetical protein